VEQVRMLPVRVLEKIIRAGVGYTFLLVAFRVLGRRQLGQLTNFDLVVVLVVANTLQNAMIGRWSGQEIAGPRSPFPPVASGPASR
jgi:hypothetical protein